MDEPLGYRNPVEELGEEFLQRHRRGEHPSVTEYVEANPSCAAEIRQLFPAMLAMEQFKNSKLSSDHHPVEMDVYGLEQLGDYRIIREIGRGGMGVVYEAEQQSLGRNVAVKVFPRQVLRDSRQLKRFHREARIAAALHHTNIVPVFGVGEQDGLHYYVMQRIVGISLDRVINGIVAPTQQSADAELDTDPYAAALQSTQTAELNVLEVASELLTSGEPTMSRDKDEPPKSIAALSLSSSRPTGSYWSSVAEVGIQVANALSYAHSQGVFHRDIKPGNLLFDRQGTVWVADFGLATAIEAEKISNPGDVVGTLRFMAPEHLDGDFDQRTDIYSLGLTLYELRAHLAVCNWHGV